jgi:probable F420-dependent oxidoreductase
MTPRPFRFSVTMPRLSTAAEVRDFARKAEDQGFDVVAAADHLLDMLPPFAALTVAAEATTNLKVATLVLNNDLRHPVLVAREAAALQALSGERFELGLGAGHAAPEYASIGVSFDGPRVRVARLAESVAVIKGLFERETTSFEGTHYQVRDHKLFPRVSRPPLLIGGNGRSTLRLAARDADIIGFTGLGKTLPDGQRHDPSGFGPAAFEARLALVREAAGDRFGELELNALVQAVLPGDAKLHTGRLMDQLTGLSAEDIRESPFLLMGSPEEMADRLKERRERWGLSYFSTFAHAMDALEPVIALLK